MDRVEDGRSTITVTGRVVEMIRYLARRAEFLNGQRRVKVEFNAAGDKLRSSAVIFGDEETVTVAKPRLGRL